MTTLDELERAVERLKKYLVERKKSRVHDPVDIHALHIGDEREAVLTVPDLRLLLSERAELLATVERMRPVLIECLSDYGHRNFTDRYGMADRIRAALTTGEAGSPIGQNDQPGLTFSDAGEP